MKDYQRWYKARMERSGGVIPEGKLCRSCGKPLSNDNCKIYDVKSGNWICLVCRREKNNRATKNYYKNKPIARVITDNRRRMQKAAAIDSTSNMERINEFYKIAKQLSKSGVQYDVDHIIPISKGGKHHENNLCILRHDINMLKSDNVDPYFIKIGKWLNSSII